MAGATKGKIDMSIKRFTLVDFEGFGVDVSNLSDIELRILETNFLISELLEEQKETNKLLRKIYTPE